MELVGVSGSAAATFFFERLWLATLMVNLGNQPSLVIGVIEVLTEREAVTGLQLWVITFALRGMGAAA